MCNQYLRVVGIHHDHVRLLNAELGNAMRDPGIASKLSGLTYDAVHRTPEELAQRLRADYDKIGKVFRQFGVRLD